MACSLGSVDVCLPSDRDFQHETDHTDPTSGAWRGRGDAFTFHPSFPGILEGTDEGEKKTSWPGYWCLVRVGGSLKSETASHSVAHCHYSGTGGSDCLSHRAGPLQGSH